VLRIEAQAIQEVLARLDASFEKAVDVLFACKGPRRGHRHGKIRSDRPEKSRQHFPARELRPFFLHAAEALHGDMGMLAPPAMPILAVSYGGETEENRFVCWKL